MPLSMSWQSTLDAKCSYIVFPHWHFSQEIPAFCLVFGSQAEESWPSQPYLVLIKHNPHNSIHRTDLHPGTGYKPGLTQPGRICLKRDIQAGSSRHRDGSEPSLSNVWVHTFVLSCVLGALGTPWERASRRFIPQSHCCSTGLVMAAWDCSFTSLVNTNEAAAQYSLAVQLEEKWWLDRVLRFPSPLSFLGKIQTHPHELFNPLWWADPMLAQKNYTSALVLLGHLLLKSACWCLTSQSNISGS